MSLKLIEIKDLIKNPLYEKPNQNLNNLIVVFKSIDNINYLIYAEKKDIIIFDLNSSTQTLKIINAHNSEIVNFNYYSDIKNKRDLILSISDIDNNIKLWNAKNFECLLDMKNIFNGHLYSSCFLINNDNIYIIASNFSLKMVQSSGVFVYDLNGKLIKIMYDSSGGFKGVCILDSYFDIELNKNYIITGNCGYCQSFDFEKNKLYHKYCDGDELTMGIVVCVNIFIFQSERKTKMIEANTLRHIKIWDFHSSELLHKIKTEMQELYILLWSEKYLLFGEKTNIQVYDLNLNKISDYSLYNDKHKEIFNLKKINDLINEKYLLIFEKNSIIISKIIEE